MLIPLTVGALAVFGLALAAVLALMGSRLTRWAAGASAVLAVAAVALAIEMETRYQSCVDARASSTFDYSTAAAYGIKVTGRGCARRPWWQ